MSKYFIADEQLLLQKAFSSYLHLAESHKTKRKHESIECELKKGIHALREKIINEQNDISEGILTGGESTRKGSSKAIVKMHKDVFRAIDVLTSKLKLKTFVQEHLVGKVPYLKFLTRVKNTSNIIKNIYRQLSDTYIVYKIVLL